jgi:hypothetical protein
MEDTLSNILLNTLPDTQMRKKRPSNKTAEKIVKNSVKGKKRNMTGEQSFRYYLRDTDKLLQESDETTDKSKLADDIEKILNVVRPDGNINHNVVNNYIRNEPIDNAEVKSEISASPLKIYNTPSGINTSLNASDLFTTPKSGRTKQQETRKAFSTSVKKHVEGKKKEKENKSATTIQSAVRNYNAKWEARINRVERKENAKKENAKKSATVIQLAVKAKKAREEVKLMEQKQQQQKAINVISSAIKTKKAKEEMLGALKEKKTTLNKLNKELDPNFYKHGKNKNKPDKVSKK